MATIRRASGRPRLTCRGIVFVTATAVALVAGLLLDNAFLRALAGFGAGAVIVAVLPALARLRPSLVRDVHPARVECGAPAVARLEVVNETGRRQPGFTARDTIGGVIRDVSVRPLPARGSAVYHYDLPTNRRGRIDVGPLEVERSDLLGLVRSRVSTELTATLRVHPRRHPVRLATGARLRHHFEGPSPRQPMHGSTDLRSLREYVVGDELRHLHWKATARTGRLMVREYVDPAQPHCVVLLDTAPAAEDDFEQAVEIAASLVWEACRTNQPTRLLTTAGTDIATPGGSAAGPLLDALSEVTSSERLVTLDPRRVAGSPAGGWFTFVTCSDDPGRLTTLMPLRRTFDPFIVMVVGTESAGWVATGARVVGGTDAAAVFERWNAAEPR